MENSNGPPRGANVTTDQSSYDLVYKDIIISSGLGNSSPNRTVYRYKLASSLNNIYKAELVSATVQFNEFINTKIINQTLILSIPQLNGNTYSIAGTNQNLFQSVQSDVFSQIPDNCTPLTLSSQQPNNIISLLIGARMYDCIQFYNPPISKINKIDVLWFSPQGDVIPVDTSGSPGTIKQFYFTLRIHYFQKRIQVSSFSTSVFNNAATGTLDSIFQSRKYRSS
jgi:hypothetical protein